MRRVPVAPITPVVVHEGSTLVVVANALRLLAYRARTPVLERAAAPTEEAVLTD